MMAAAVGTDSSAHKPRRGEDTKKAERERGEVVALARWGVEGVRDVVGRGFGGGEGGLEPQAADEEETADPKTNDRRSDREFKNKITQKKQQPQLGPVLVFFFGVPSFTGFLSEDNGDVRRGLPAVSTT